MFAVGLKRAISSTPASVTHMSPWASWVTWVGAVFMPKSMLCLTGPRSSASAQLPSSPWSGSAMTSSKASSRGVIVKVCDSPQSTAPSAAR